MNTSTFSTDFAISITDFAISITDFAISITDLAISITPFMKNPVFLLLNAGGSSFLCSYYIALARDSSSSDSVPCDLLSL